VLTGHVPALAEVDAERCYASARSTNWLTRAHYKAP